MSRLYDEIGEKLTTKIELKFWLNFSHTYFVILSTLFMTVKISYFWIKFFIRDNTWPQQFLEVSFPLENSMEISHELEIYPQKFVHVWKFSGLSKLLLSNFRKKERFEKTKKDFLKHNLMVLKT